MTQCDSQRETNITKKNPFWFCSYSVNESVFTERMLEKAEKAAVSLSFHVLTRTYTFVILSFIQLSGSLGFTPAANNIRSLS